MYSPGNDAWMVVSVKTSVGNGTAGFRPRTTVAPGAKPRPVMVNTPAPPPNSDGVTVVTATSVELPTGGSAELPTTKASEPATSPSNGATCTKPSAASMSPGMLNVAVVAVLADVSATIQLPESSDRL